MKRAKFPLLGLLAVILMNAFFAFTPVKAKASEVAGCRVEVFDCPGIGTGDRQICHTTAPENAVSCTCGESTPCPE